MSAFSAIFVLKENGTQSHSAKFLNWGDHVNSVQDLAASPPWARSSRPLDKAGPGLKALKALKASVGLKIRGARPPRAPILNPPLLNELIII